MASYFNQPTIWMVSGPVLVLYVAAVGMVLLLRAANDKLCAARSKRKAVPPAAAFLLALVLNFLGVVILVLLASALSVATRLSMLALPLLLLVERYGMKIRRGDPRQRRVPALALAGSVAGLLMGAFFFMRAATTSEPVARVAVPGDVRTMGLSEVSGSAANWSVSLELAVFYLVSVAIFSGLHAVVRRTAQKLSARLSRRGRVGDALAGVLAFALNFMGVVALVHMAASCGVQTRLAMVGFPLFLVAESYVKLLYAEPGSRGSHWIGLLCSCGGMVSGTFFLLRGAPLH